VLNRFDELMNIHSESFPLRPAWTEIDLGRLRRNLQLIRRALPARVRLLAVVKDEAYGHGALDVARIALEEGAWGFGLSTLEEAMGLRDAGITAPLLLLGERREAELEWCVAHHLTVCVNEPHTVRALAKIAAEHGRQTPVHIKINTGMSRYGVRWDEALPLIERVAAAKSLLLEGVMTHFAQSDEVDKTFANLQFTRFNEVLQGMAQRNISAPLRHTDVGEGEHRGDSKNKARRNRWVRHALHRADRAAHRHFADWVRRRFSARAQRRLCAHPWPACAAGRGHCDGRADGGHHGHTAGEDVG